MFDKFERQTGKKKSAEKVVSPTLDEFLVQRFEKAAADMLLAADRAESNNRRAAQILRDMQAAQAKLHKK